MQRQRGELVPVGDALSGMGGPMKSIREASPQALHHYTRFDQVNQLVSASEADADLGFMARLLALCSLPRTNPGSRLSVQARPTGPVQAHHDCRWGLQAPHVGKLGNTLTARLSTSPPALMWAEGGARLPYDDDPSTIRVIG